MGTTFWLRRAATVFAMTASVLFVVSVLQGRGLAGSVEFTAIWATASTAVFIGARLYQSSRGQHCALCQDIPTPVSESEPPPTQAR
jgi:hypothetical protein